MWVRYTGKGELITEFNGKKYMFSYKHREKDIPPEVLQSIFQSGHVNSTAFEILTGPTPKFVPAPDKSKKARVTIPRFDKEKKSRKRSTKKK